MIKHLIFDLDGTLVDCKRLHQEAFERAVKEHSPSLQYDWSTLENYRTVEKIKMLQKEIPELSFDSIKASKERITQALLSDYVNEDPELESQMHRLKKTYLLSCASNASDIFVKEVLSILQIKDLFSIINCGNEFPHKPDPTIYIDCMERTNTNKEQTVIFEDSVLGVKGATSTGAQVITVKTVNHLKEILEKY